MDTLDSQRLREYLDLSPDDRERVRGLRETFRHHAGQFAERFYEHLRASPLTAGFIRDDAVLQRLKRVQAAYFAELLEGQFDQVAYVRKRLSVGATHERVGIEPISYLGAYNQYIQITFPMFVEAFGDDLSTVLPALLSLVKVIFFDISLALETYFRQATEQIRQRNDELQRTLTLLQQTQQSEARLLKQRWQWVTHLRYESPRYRLIGSSPAMARVHQMIEKVAPTDATVLVRGPSGTGKELVARAIHYNSPRREHPLVTINCAALQETLLESELFGHEKGAFTGAVAAKPGLFEVAEGGSLFVDEIAEMAPGLQAKLLRVLEDGRYRRVGGTHEIQANVRVIAATNKVLEEEQKAGHFREDLFYRLNVFAIYLPPLRERRTDIPELIEHLLTTRPVGSTRSQLTPDALDVLVRYDWPGNVRELANVLERAQILAEDNRITLDDLPESMLDRGTFAISEDGDPLHLRAIERRHVEMVLLREKGNKVQAAKALGISRRALYRLIEKHRIDV